MLLQQPLNTSLRRLFVTGQENDEVALRLPGFALQPNEVRHEYGRARLVVVTCRVRRTNHPARSDVHGSTDQSTRGAGTTSKWAISRTGRTRGFRPRNRATRFPVRASGPRTLTSSRGMPAAIRRSASAWAARGVVPVRFSRSNLDQLFEYLARQCAVRRRERRLRERRLQAAAAQNAPSARGASAIGSRS